MSDSIIERVARALCSFEGLPEDTLFEGRPMWTGYIDQARVAIEAMRQPTGAMKAKGAESFDLSAADAAIGAAIVYGDMIDVALVEETE